MHTNLIPADLIRKKRDRQTLTPEEIQAFFGGVTSGSVSDYQASAMLMAICLNGMDYAETAALTRLMRDSGHKLSWPEADRPVVDKHSTGGVGDKTSLVLLPLCALHGVLVPMMSGRGLGHTGGTLDKLESIPGMNVFPNPSEAKNISALHHGVFLGQTNELAPLDKKLYSLRDVTGTVESIPLITASILAKKLASGLQALVMDVKYGSGAFMPTLAEAESLASSISHVATLCGLKITSLLTNMNTPLGRTAGNSLEVIECIELMQGNGPADSRHLSLALAAEMLCLADTASKYDDVYKSLEQDLVSGRCFEKFCQIIASQGGDISYLQNPEKFPKASNIQPVLAPSTGWIKEIDVRAVGMTVVQLGGGRRQATDKVDPTVGLSQLCAVGEHVEKGQPLAYVHANSTKDADVATKMIQEAYCLTADKQTETVPLIAKRIVS